MRRDRHGRGLRAPLLPYDAPGYLSRSEWFDNEVRSAAERLEGRWGRHWGKVDFGTEDIPPSEPSPWEPGVPLARLFPADLGQPSRVVLYRRPLEGRAQGSELRALIRDIVAEQVGHLVNRAPEDVDPDYGLG